MKNLKLILSAIGILAGVGTSLALTTKPFGQGMVYCDSACTMQIDYKVSCSGVTNPCGGSIQEYVKVSCSVCVASSGPFLATAVGE